jgi:hypothetical protein
MKDGKTKSSGKAQAEQGGRIFCVKYFKIKQQANEAGKVITYSLPRAKLARL